MQIVNLRLRLKSARGLLNKNRSRNHDLLEETCRPCIDLIKNNFERHTLKGEPFNVFDSAVDWDELFSMCHLDDTLSPMDTLRNLTHRPLLERFLDHFARERTYFFSILKCGKDSCTV